MRERSKTVALFVAGVTVGAALTLFLAPAFSNSKTTSEILKSPVRVLADDGKAPTHMKIVPADVLGKAVSFSPLTGDGSN